MAARAPLSSARTAVLWRSRASRTTGAAYDKYTRLGLRAIDRFAAEAVEVQQFVQAVKPPKRRYAAGVRVFLAEGGVLARRAVYSDESERVYRWVRSPERMHWMPRELAIEYLDAVRRPGIARRRRISRDAAGRVGSFWPA